ncbi:eukaryotic translation initiation factor 5B-like [Pyrus ussuriensis x Pyrus communis]|uniref:Eukaryotic translation initiation factor 5B-like n=1 Tax=Pyrus ussuriensis x Pyrus communis TaxID=2448454 RepID=A0A5N5I4C9_9ROSA|nr:eukaryotic translation initiation factor 5B-like [Pyrus ussuriensis x Pyrus communis]
MGMKDKKKTHKSKKAVQPNLEIVEKGSAEMRKRKRAKESDADSQKVVQVSVEAKDTKKTKLTKKRKIKNVKNYVAVESENDHPNTETDDDCNEINDDGVANQSRFETQEEIEIGEVFTEAGKSKKAKKKKKKDRNPLEFVKSLEKEIEAGRETAQEEYKISESTEWVTEYHQSRPGLKELQQRIDQFMVEHDEKLEQRSRAAEGGWTVVVHYKGRKKTTDAESGITVGSVAQAALEDKVAKKKQTEVVGLDFYRFQRKEAQRNEIMMLQSKFEQDKKRILQLRAARKFRPY